MLDRTAFNATVDDTSVPPGTNGTIVDKAFISTVLLDPMDGRWSEASITLTGTQDNVDYTQADTLRCTNATALTIRGLLAPATPAKPAKRLLILALGVGTVTLNDQDANSTAANRIVTGTAAPVVLAAGSGWAWLVYDAITGRYRVTASSAGSGSGSATVQTTTLTGAQNNFAQTAASRLVLRCNNATLLTITGFAAGTDGDEILLESVGAGQVDLAHQNASSTAANRLINCATSGNTSLAAGTGTARFVYDGTAARWRLTQHEQGAWITPAYAAGDFTASGSMTWTVDAGDVTMYRYWLKGRTLFVAWTLVTTSVGGTVSQALYLKIPGGFSIALQATNGMMYRDNGGPFTFAASWCTNATPTQIELFTVGFGTGTWTLSTNATVSYGSITVEVT